MSSDLIFPDSLWSDERWKKYLEHLIELKVITWEEVTGLTLGHLNPSQVGTSLASSDGFKRRYGKGHTMSMVMEWFYNQLGYCVDCKTRLELQADHSKPREEFTDPLDADFIENMVLRCRRCNVIKRQSHVFGGQTYLTAESALMWILFTFRPRSLHDFQRLCRLYGMTMADIRMQEGWAMASWLARDPYVKYQLDGFEPHLTSEILKWKDDGAITRCWSEELDQLPSGFDVMHSGVIKTANLCFVAVQSDNSTVSAYRVPVSTVPFTYRWEIINPVDSVPVGEIVALDSKEIATDNVEVGEFSSTSRDLMVAEETATLNSNPLEEPVEQAPVDFVGIKADLSMPQALAVRYYPPKRDTDPPTPAAFFPLAPRGMKLLCSTIQETPMPWRVSIRFDQTSKIFDLEAKVTGKKLMTLASGTMDRVEGSITQ